MKLSEISDAPAETPKSLKLSQVPADPAGAPSSGDGAFFGLAKALPESVSQYLPGFMKGPSVGEQLSAADVARQAQEKKLGRPLSLRERLTAEPVTDSPVAMGFATHQIGELPAVATGARAATTLQNKASDVISRQFEKGVRGGAPTAADVAQELTKARAEGQPLTLADVNNPALAQLTGTTYRQGGTVRTLMKSFFETRGQAAGVRVEEMINRHLSDESVKGTAAKLINDRSAHAKPLWDEARSGGSLPPISEQFVGAFNEASKRVSVTTEKVSRLQQAHDAATDTETIRINQLLPDAIQEMQAATATRINLAQRLREAQADGSLNAKGAVWSPRLQELLDSPEVQQGIRHGWAMERRTATGDGRPFNPTDYAVTGVDKKGNPVIGKVPNMSLLMVAKEGLDAIIDSPKMKDKLTGRPTKDGLSYIRLRDGLVQELDRLNPKYAEARNAWSGDTASIRALGDGRKFLEKAKFSPEDLAEYYGKLSDNDKQFFTVGVADALKSKLFRSADSANKGRVINTEDARMRLRPLFGSDAEADAFIDAMERERVMGTTGGRVYGGSPSAERVHDDLSTAVHGAHAVVQALQGRWLSSVASAVRMRRMFGGKVDEALAEQVGKALVDPNVSVSDVGPLLPQKPLPPRELPTTRPGIVGPAPMSPFTTPSDSDTMRRAASP